MRLVTALRHNRVRTDDFRSVGSLAAQAQRGIAAGNANVGHSEAQLQVEVAVTVGIFDSGAPIDAGTARAEADRCRIDSGCVEFRTRENRNREVFLAAQVDFVRKPAGSYLSIELTASRMCCQFGSSRTAQVARLVKNVVLEAPIKSRISIE